MIMLTRLNGQPFALNPDLIERAETTPDTVLTLCDGTKLIVGETVEQLTWLVREYRASVISLAQQMDAEPAGMVGLHVVPEPGES